MLFGEGRRSRSAGRFPGRQQFAETGCSALPLGDGLFPLVYAVL